MMTFIAFAAVAVASFFAGGITCVAFAAYLESNYSTWYEDNVETPMKKRTAERESLTTILDYTNVN